MKGRQEDTMREEETDRFSPEDLRGLFAPPPYPETTERIRERLLLSLRALSRRNGAPTSWPSSSLATRFLESGQPLQPWSFEDYVQLLDDDILPHVARVASPHSLGHMTSGVPGFMRVLGDLVLGLNQNLVKKDASRVLTLLERQTIGMMHRLAYRCPAAFYDSHIQDEDSTLGIATSGGTLANITALWIARNSCLGPRDAFAGVEATGLPAALDHYGYDRAVIIGSSLMHYSLEKAVSILGFGADSLLKIPVDRHGCVCIGHLRNALADCRRQRARIVAIVGIAGSTDCGSIDALGELASAAREAGVHFHVDAAWGTPLLFSALHRDKLNGIERADSVTLDGHKQLCLPIGNGLLLLRNPTAAGVIAKATRYMLQEGTGDLGRCSMEGSRPASTLFLHAALHVIGQQGYEFIGNENIRKAQVMAAMIRDRPEWELLMEPQTSIVLYRYIPERWRVRRTQCHMFTPEENRQLNELNESLQKIQSEKGSTFVSRTIIENSSQGEGAPIAALRAVIVNPLVEDADLRAVLEDQAAIGAELEQTLPPRRRVHGHEDMLFTVRP